jgi:hypothetical protein
VGVAVTDVGGCVCVRVAVAVTDGGVPGVRVRVRVDDGVTDGESVKVAVGVGVRVDAAVGLVVNVGGTGPEPTRSLNCCIGPRFPAVSRQRTLTVVSPCGNSRLRGTSRQNWAWVCAPMN